MLINLMEKDLLAMYSDIFSSALRLITFCFIPFCTLQSFIIFGAAV